MVTRDTAYMWDPKKYRISLKAKEMANHQVRKLPSFKGIGQSSWSPHTNIVVKSIQDTVAGFISNTEPRNDKHKCIKENSICIYFFESIKLYLRKRYLYFFLN